MHHRRAKRLAMAGLPNPCGRLVTVRNGGHDMLVDHGRVSGVVEGLPPPRNGVTVETLLPAAVPPLPAVGWARSYARALVVFETVAAAVAGGTVVLTRSTDVPV